ncbi:MAG: type II toxin-antitoxin system VapB family antitoxin [Halothece sp. Uz-M2-17]|nr:type II toxin-antitoxin system VapB family antitoxin [Halothece sp. Uz-M2-17]
MAINIKNSDVDRLIQQLRAMTGEGPTEIVKRALEREYQELRRERRQAQLAEKLPDLQETAQTKAQEFDANTLYDEKGLPL